MKVGSMKNRNNVLLVLCILFCSYFYVAISDGTGGGQEECLNAATCGDCLQKNPMCAWCETNDYSDTGKSRCDTEDNLLTFGCLNYTMPLTEIIKLEDEELSDAEGHNEAIQVQPQRVSLKIRSGDTHTLRMKVRQAEDYPVDLYYVMDLSRSMQDDLEKLKVLGKIIAEEMGTITSNFRLGFGVFVDKTVLPYISTVPRKINEPCPGCEAPYSFRNVLPLDNRTDLFAKKVNQTKISGNLDTPEGSLDALMQATVCKGEIGWRERARHLIVYTSDASFHIAGDGRLGGIVTPSDGKCHLNVDGEYDDAHLYDYPSIGQLNAKMRENNIIPIFAVVESKHDLYQNLTELIEGSNVGTLLRDSSNIVDIIKNNYEKITQRVQIVDTAPAGLDLSYSSRCAEGGEFEDGNTCTGLRLGETVEFDVAITARDCLGGSKNTSFEIQPIGFEEALTVEVEVICECDCEEVAIEGDDVCTFGNGSLICGECMCKDGRYGKKCECSGDVIGNEEDENESGCRPANATHVCFGRGECVCGECVCNTRPDPREVISGTYCECDNFSCARYKGELCGGPERGDCVCDTKTRQSACKCRPGFQGLACDCPTRQDSCRANNGLICNALGNCTCGECRCDPNSRFQGARCDECATCSEDQCFFHQACLQCKAFNAGRLTKEQCDMCLIEIQEVETLPYVENSKNCSFVDDTDNCSINFAYQTSDDRQKITIFYEKIPICARSMTGSLIEDPSRGVKQGEAGSGLSSSSSSSYRHHVIHQRASKSDSQHSKRPAEKSHGTTTRNVAESTTSQKPKSDVKLRLGERHVEEVIVSDVSRKRQGLGSVVAQVIHHDVEEESSDEDVSAAKKVASSVRATRRPTLPKSRQANTSLLKRAVSEATASTSSGIEKQVSPWITPQPPGPPPSKINRTKVQAVKPAIVREITQRVATSSGRISSSSGSDQGIQSRSLQREFLDRDFDSQTFQTVENQAEGDVDGNEGEHEEQELVEVVPVVGQKGVFVYKNVVAVVGSSRRTVDEAQAEPVNEEEDIEESFQAVIQQEADSRQIYVAENVSVADSTQSPENPLEEEIEEVAFEEEEEEDGEMQLPEEGYSVEEEGQKVPKGVTQIGASPRFIVTLEGAQRHLNLSANQRRKIQRKAVKRGHAQTAHMPDIVITKQPRKSLSPEVKRQFIFTDTRGPEEVAPVMTPEEMDQEEEEEEESMLVEKAPFMVYSNVPKVEPLTISMQDSDEDEGFEAEEPSQREESNKANERCKFWPACKNGDSCTFMHPTTPCRTFPKCKFGDKCLYIHPNCKFDSLCTKPSCPYTHATRKSVPPVALHLGKPMLHLPAPPPPPRQGVKAACKFHPGCQNPQCTFLHPKLCRFGKGCSRLGCKFFHANVAVRSSLTWTKEAKHISQRPFAAPTSTPAPVPKSAHLHIRPVLTPSPNMSSPPK